MKNLMKIEMKVYVILIVGMLLMATLMVPLVYAEKISLKYFYPVGVAGPLAKIMTDMVNEYNIKNPNVHVEPVYAGSYVETLQKALTAALGGNPPDISVMTSVDVWALKDAGVITPIDEFVEKAGGEKYLEDFFSAFVEDCKIDGKLWAIPFQKSTPIFYYNKELFKEMGFDPERAPRNWDELLDYSKKLTLRDERGEIKRWGLQIPIDGWVFSAYVFQNGGKLNSEDGKRTFLEDPLVIEALQFWVDLANKYKVMPRKRLFGDSAADFVAGQTAMMYNSPGSLGFVRKSAKFDFNVAFLPMRKRYAVPTGGGQIVIFKDIPRANKEAIWDFINWMTSSENAARWSIDSGYVAVRKSAFEVPTMKEYVGKWPHALVARNQLQYAQREIATHEGRKYFEILRLVLEATLFEKEAPAQALGKAQAEMEDILKKYRK